MIDTILHNIKQGVREIPGYEPPPFECRIKLNQNENSFSLPLEFKHRIAVEFEKMEWGRYPSCEAAELKQRLSERVGFPAEGILPGNGSNELIQALILGTLSPCDSFVIASPTFTLYKHLGKIAEVRVVEVPLNNDLTYNVDAFVEIINEIEPKLMLLASPNNPTGISLALEDVEQLLQASSGFVTIDEAYIEFAGNPEGCLKLMDKYPNLIITRTYSKAMNAAGLRLGYMIADPRIACEIKKVLLPYNLGKFSRFVAIKLLEAKEILSEQIAEILRQREWLFKELQGIPGIHVYPSEANFLLIESKNCPAEDLYQSLYQRGILVRNVSSYPMLSRCLRVSVGTKEENAAFIADLREIIG